MVLIMLTKHNGITCLVNKDVYINGVHYLLSLFATRAEIVNRSEEHANIRTQLPNIHINGSIINICNNGALHNVIMVYRRIAVCYLLLKAVFRFIGYHAGLR